MSLTISPNPLYPSLHTKHTHNIFSKSPQISQNSIFTKPKNNIRVSASCPSSVLGNSANPFGKFGKVQCFLGSSLSHLRAQLSNFEAFGAVNGDFEVTMWALTDFIGSFWPRSVCEGYLFSTSNHAVVPAFLRPGLVNMNVRKSRVIVSAFNNPDRRLPKKEEQKMMHEGLITESLPNGMFRVQLDNKDMIIGYISGKMRKNFIRILPGDRVKVEVSRYDSTRGRIVLRIRNKSTSE